MTHMLYKTLIKVISPRQNGYSSTATHQAMSLLLLIYVNFPY